MGTSVAEIERKKRILELRVEKLRRKYPKLWLARYCHKTTHGERLSFGDKFRFLIDIYKDLETYPRVTCRKAVQSGITDLLIVSALDDASKGLRVFYVMPNRDLRNDFVKDRFDTLLKTVPYYGQGIKEAVGDSESVGLKHFYRGLINFASSNSKIEFISYQSDANYIDEVDKCDPKNLKMAPDRMDASKYKLERTVGNPSAEKFGIDGIYKKSTQGVWKVKCPHCGKWQELDFFKNVVDQEGKFKYRIILPDQYGNPLVACIKCGKEIDRLGPGEWIHRFESPIRGFTVNQLFSANVSVKELYEYFLVALTNDTALQLFYNSKLGLPFSSEGSKIVYKMLEDASEDSNYTLSINDISKAIKCKGLFVGIDVGKYFHIVAREKVVGGKKRLVYVGRLARVEEVVDLLSKLNIRIAVIDEEPEVKLVEQIKVKIKRLYSCDYISGHTFLDIKKSAQEYKKERRVKIDRTFILDHIRSDYEGRLMINPVNCKDIGNEENREHGEYYDHLLSSTRIYDEDSNSFNWRESGADHLFHAEAYCRMAQELDDKILQYYIDSTSEEKTREDAAKKLIPDTKDKTPEEMDPAFVNMTAAEFLRKLTNKNSDFLSPMRKNKGE